MADDVKTQSGADADTAGSNKFRNWHGTLNCGFTGQSCLLSVGGEYHLAMRCGGGKLEKRTTDFNPTLFTIDVVDSDGDGGDWIKLSGEFHASPEVTHVIVKDEHGASTKFPVQRRDT